MNKYGRKPEIFKQVRQEWATLPEIDTIVELAAVYEFTTWLKHHKHPYLLDGSTAFGMVNYLLGFYDTNPLPPHLCCSMYHKAICRKFVRNVADECKEMDMTMFGRNTQTRIRCLISISFWTF